MDDVNDPPPRFNSGQPFGLPAATPQGHIPHEEPRLGSWPFKAIWFNPRDTIRLIVNTNPELHVNLLIILAGIAESLDRASSKNAGDKISSGMLFLMICVIGPGMSLIGAWIYTHLIRIAGNWLGGRGVYDEIKASIGWSSVPTIVILLLWVPLLILFGKEMFTEEMPSVAGKPGLATALLAISLAQLVLGIWALVLLCNTIAEVQEYRSAWKALGNLILAGLIIIIPILVIAFGIMALKGA